MAGSALFHALTANGTHLLLGGEDCAFLCIEVIYQYVGLSSHCIQLSLLGEVLQHNVTCTEKQLGPGLHDLQEMCVAQPSHRHHEIA